MPEATLKTILTAQDRNTRSTISGVGKEAESTGGKLSKMGTVAKAGALAAAGGFAALVGVGVKLAKNAAEDQAQARRLAVALKNTTGATKQQIAANEQWISQQGVQLGVTDDELRPALNKLVTATHNVAKAHQLASLAMNISAGTGKSLEVVSMALAKAQNGNVAALGRLGLKTKDAEGKTKSLKDVVADLSNTYKGQATAAADSVEGKFGRLKLIMDETGESIGYKLLPMALALANFLLTKVYPATQRLGAEMSAKLGPAFARVGEWITSNLLPALGKIASWIMTNVVPAVRQLAEKWLAGLRDGIGHVKDHIGQLQPFITLIVAAFKGWWAVVSNVLLPALGKIYGTAFPLLGRAIGAIITIIGALSKAVIWLWNNAFQPVFKLIANVVGIAFEWVGRLLSALGHVPGFGWAKKLGQDMSDAAGAARGLADSINKIPTKHNVDVNLNVKVPRKAPGILDVVNGLKGGSNAVGDRRSAGGLRLVGERGAELVDMPRGARVYTAGETASILAGGGGDAEGTIVIEVRNPDTGEVIEQKLVKVKRKRGGRKLYFEDAS